MQNITKKQEYIRVWEIQGNYGQGWECVTEESTRQDAKKMLKDYRTNVTQYPHRMKKLRRKIGE